MFSLKWRKLRNNADIYYRNYLFCKLIIIKCYSKQNNNNILYTIQFVLIHILSMATEAKEKNIYHAAMSTNLRRGLLKKVSLLLLLLTNKPVSNVVSDCQATKLTATSTRKFMNTTGPGFGYLYQPNIKTGP